MFAQSTEYEELLRLIDASRGRIETRTVCEVTHAGQRLPVYAHRHACAALVHRGLARAYRS
jgi:hypothetical protein